MDWNTVLNWRLLSGSHKFPGPDGGTCINEAAILAAGFEYRAVSSAADCPPCFSWVLATYAIALNDSLPDEHRQLLLMPFVTRLAGTADVPEIERQRFDYIMLGSVRSVLPISLLGCKADLIAQCERVTNYDEAIAVLHKVALGRVFYHIPLNGVLELVRTLDLASARDLEPELANVLALIRAIYRARAVELDRPRDVIHVAYLVSTLGFFCPHVLDLARAPGPKIYKAQVALLDGAMKIGNQAPPIEHAAVIGRMANIRPIKAASHSAAE